MILETIPDVNRLTPAEKLQLVTELWDDIAAHPLQVPVSSEQIAENCQSGRGELLLKSLNAGFAQLSVFPEIAPRVHNPYRRLLVSGFPYGIFYVVEGRRVIVVGVLGFRRDPKAIHQRIE